MDWMTFVSNMTGHVAWPATAAVIALVYRREIRSLVERIRKLKAGPLETEMFEIKAKETKEITLQLERLPSAPPYSMSPSKFDETRPRPTELPRPARPAGSQADEPVQDAGTTAPDFGDTAPGAPPSPQPEHRIGDNRPIQINKQEQMGERVCDWYGEGSAPWFADNPIERERAKERRQERLSELEDRLLTGLNRSPQMTVLAAWGPIEFSLRKLAGRLKVKTHMPFRSIILELSRLGAISTEEVRVIFSLYELRNEAAHNTIGVTEQAGLDYIASATSILRRLQAI